jgi:tetratricopeptide (TPR) repeat protein
LGVNFGALLVAMACGSPARTPLPVERHRAPALRPVALPPLAGMSESVAEQMQERYAAVERERDRAPRNDHDHAQAYGELGKVLLGARYLDAAEPALANAAALDAADIRWPYYLGHVYRGKGAVRESAGQLNGSQPGPQTSRRSWLADAYVSEGRLDAADRWCARDQRRSAIGRRVVPGRKAGAGARRPCGGGAAG